jgi:pyruvate formate lyase activating enzyme
MKTISGSVNKILKQSFVDGPGNRAVVFLQGCNFRCLYCHNPYTQTLCSQCDICVSACSYGALSVHDNHVVWDEALCHECDSCIQACPQNSSPRVRDLTSQQIWEIIAPIEPFLSGVTASGGEPTQQMDFLLDFFSLIKKKSRLTTLIETNGCVEIKFLEPLLPVLDYALIDLKAWDPSRHKELTSAEYDQVLKTIRFLAQHSRIYEVRNLVVPGYSDDLETAASIARFIAGIDPTIPLNFLRFRSHGTRGIAEGWETPSEEVMDRQVEIARAEGLLHVKRSL